MLEERQTSSGFAGGGWDAVTTSASKQSARTAG